MTSGCSSTKTRCLSSGKNGVKLPKGLLALIKKRYELAQEKSRSTGQGAAGEWNMSVFSGLGVMLAPSSEGFSEEINEVDAILEDGAAAAGASVSQQAGVNEMVETVQKRAVEELSSYLTCVCMRTMFA